MLWEIQTLQKKKKNKRKKRYFLQGMAMKLTHGALRGMSKTWPSSFFLSRVAGRRKPSTAQVDGAKRGRGVRGTNPLTCVAEAYLINQTQRRHGWQRELSEAKETHT